MIDIKSMTAAVAATSADMNTAVKGGGGNYVPPAEGACRLRFIAYVETGAHMNNIPGKPPKRESQVELTFELSGPKHPPKVLEDGTKIPHRIGITLNHSLNEKATFYKLFRRMNYKGTATHMSQLLGEAFKGVVTHKVVGEGEAKRTYANLKDDSGFTIQPPRYEDPDTGESRELVVDPAISPMRLFVWNADAQFLGPMWESIFIDGTYGTGDNVRSANVFQDTIKKALNFAGSPIESFLSTGQVNVDIPDTATTPTKAAPADPLDNV
jgi:hypothetical protein